MTAKEPTAKEPIEKRLKKLAQAIGPDDKLIENVMNRIDTKSISESERIEKLSAKLIARRFIMNRFTKLAAAAVIIIAVLIGIYQFGSSIDGSSVAWADVSEKVGKIQTYIFRVRQTETSGPKKEGFEFVTEKEGITYNSLEYGNKTEFYRNGELTTRSYLLRKEEEFIGICPPAKDYVRHPLSEADIREMDQMSPREMVKRFMLAEYRSLGFETINGIKVEGIEVDNPKVLKEDPPPTESFTARLWVDIETKLPVWLELEFILNGSSIRTKMVVDQFQWNVELDASVFEPNIPPDYTLDTHESTPPVVQEEQLAAEDQIIYVDVPDINSLNLLGVQEERATATVALVGMKQIWKAQDAIMSTWPVYSDIRERLHGELVAKLEIDNLSDEQLVTTAVALREKFWQAGGGLSETSYPYGYAARILVEDAHDENPENMTVTDELVETIHSVELVWRYEIDSDETVRNISLRNTLAELRSSQFEQIKRELEEGRTPAWEDFVRVNDLAILLQWAENF